MKAYEHSKSFDSFKAIHEKVTGNLTSLQYLQTLDLFLWNALAPIHSECPSFFNNFVSKIVVNQTLKASTKFTSDDRLKLPMLLFNMLTSSDIKKAHEHVKNMHINRGLLFGMLTLFNKIVSDYEDLHSPLNDLNPIVRKTRMYNIEQAIGFSGTIPLYSVIKQVRYWHEKARWWKEIIMEKYTRMAIMHAQLAYVEYNHSVKLDDVIQIYLMTVNRAIDRCDSRQGVLTTFITNWFKSARSEVAVLAKGQVDQSVEALTEEYGDAVSDIIGFALPVERNETTQHIAYVSKQVDKFGYIRAWLGIPEYVNAKDRSLLELMAIEK